MNKKEKAHPVTTIMEQASESAAFDRAAILNSNSNMMAINGQPKISDLLHTGSENGVTLSELVQLTGEDERSIRRRIQTERKAGKLILSDCKSGYFLPTSTLDVQRFISSMSRRSREIASISHAAVDALLKMTGQEKMVGW